MAEKQEVETKAKPNGSPLGDPKVSYTARDQVFYMWASGGQIRTKLQQNSRSKDDEERPERDKEPLFHGEKVCKHVFPYLSPTALPSLAGLHCQ